MANTSGRMEESMRATMKWTRKTDSANINGQTAGSTMGSGKTASSMARANS